MNTVGQIEEEKRTVQITGLNKPGLPIGWEVPERRLSSRDVINKQEGNLKFLDKLVYDLLPTPENRNRCFATEESCQLYGGS